jgi:hypothetical protein
MPLIGTCGLGLASWSGVGRIGTGRIERSGREVSFLTEWPTVTWFEDADDAIAAWLDEAGRPAVAGVFARDVLGALWFPTPASTTPASSNPASTSTPRNT